MSYHKKLEKIKTTVLKYELIDLDEEGMKKLEKYKQQIINIEKQHREEFNNMLIKNREINKKKEKDMLNLIGKSDEQLTIKEQKLKYSLEYMKIIYEHKSSPEYSLSNKVEPLDRLNSTIMRCSKELMYEYLKWLNCDDDLTTF